LATVGAMDKQGFLSRIPSPVLYALAPGALVIALAGLVLSIALKEPGALAIAFIPALWLCLLRLELRDRAARKGGRT
jgi:hypothetical protein